MGSHRNDNQVILAVSEAWNWLAVSDVKSRTHGLQIKFEGLPISTLAR
jgi:hypothetical protein